jgi:hypothetical protein
MANVIKGTYCRACDRAESNFRFGDKNLWKVGLKDLHEYYSNCYRHIKNTATLFKYTDHVMLTLHYLYKDKVKLVRPKLRYSTFDQFMLFLKSAYRCSKHKHWCNSQILLESFAISPMTMDEIRHVDYVGEVADYMVKYFSSLKSPISYDRKLLAKWKVEDAAQYKIAHDGQHERRNYCKANKFSVWRAKRDAELVR